jgi:hypothetical protein
VFEVTNWPASGAKKAYATLSAKLTISKDGAEDPIDQFLEAGFIYPERGQAVSEDGTTLEGKAGVGEGTEFARFVQSAIDKGFDQNLLLDESGNGSNFSALAENRYEFGRAINEPKQLASGAKKLGVKDLKAIAADGSYTGKLGKSYTKAEVMEAGKKQDKNDKSIYYNQTFLVIEDLLGETVSPAPKAAGKKAAAKPAAKMTVAKGGKPNGAAKEVEPDYETADALLIDAVAAAKNKTLKKASLSSAVVKWAVENDKANEERDAIRALFADDDYLARQNGWKFDGEGKDKPVSIGG